MDLSRNIQQMSTLATRTEAELTDTAGIQLENEEISLKELSVHRCLGFCSLLLDHIDLKLNSGRSIGLIESVSSSQVVTKDNNEPSTIVNTTGKDITQFFVSTNGNNIHGVNRGGNRGYGGQLQVAGYLSDESLQQISRDMSKFRSR